MTELVLFVEVLGEISQKIQLSPNNAQSINLPNGGQVVLKDPESGATITCLMEATPDVLDFSLK